MPLVSVVVPSYNHGSFLEECLRSALEQTVANLEVVMVDDRSTDNSVDIAREIRDDRLRIIVNEQNLGTYGTQNRGLDEARGENVAILNSDDRWKPTKLERQIEALQRFPQASLCYTLGLQIDAEGEALDVDQHEDWPRSEVQDLFPYLLSSNRLLASSVMFRRNSVRFNESLRYSGDWVAWLMLAERGPALCIAEQLTDWRQHSSNSYVRSSAVTTEEIRVRRAILSRKARWLAGRGETAVKAGLSACAVDLAALYLLVGEGRLARQAASAAVRLMPESRAAQRRLALACVPLGLARRRLWGDHAIELEQGALRRIPDVAFKDGGM